MSKLLERDEAQISNHAADTILSSAPYRVRVMLQGTTPLLYHRYNVESVAEKAAAAKGSKAKKTDDVESYVYRDDDGNIAIPGRWLHSALTYAAKYFQDPRSSRKSMCDLMKAAVAVEVMSSVLPLTDKWHYDDVQPCVVQRARIPRTRPALKSGWNCAISIDVLLPEYVTPDILHQILTRAGQTCGLGDFRPTYGRFRIDGFMVEEL